MQPKEKDHEWLQAMESFVSRRFFTSLLVIDLIKARKLGALDVTGPKRLAVLPEVPTIVEQGFPDLVVEDWVSFAVKNGTPGEIVMRLNPAINDALAKPQVREAFAKLGADSAGGTPAGMEGQRFPFNALNPVRQTARLSLGGHFR
jgi:Tripartite tricarboxylate transporter family receptor